MNKKKLLGSLLVALPLAVMSQSFIYKYDASGNVVSRTKLSQSDTIQIVISSNVVAINYNSSTSKATISVSYHKPQTSNLVFVNLYNANSNLLLEQESFSGTNYELDLSSRSNGIYIIEVIYQQETFTKKIIKQ